MLEKDKMEKLKELIGVDNIEIIQASSPEEGIAKIREIIDRKMSEAEKSKLVDEILNTAKPVEKYISVGASLANILMESGVPREVATGGCLAVASNCAQELKAEKPCEIAKIRDEKLLPLVQEIEEKIKPIISTLPANKVVAALSGIALNVICKEEELTRKIDKNKSKVDPVAAVQDALKRGDFLEAQGILNTILKNQ